MAERHWRCEKCGNETTDHYGVLDSIIDLGMALPDMAMTIVDGMMGGKGESSLSCQPPKCCDKYMKRTG